MDIEEIRKKIEGVIYNNIKRFDYAFDDAEENADETAKEILSTEIVLERECPECRGLTFIQFTPSLDIPCPKCNGTGKEEAVTVEQAIKEKLDG